MVGAGFCEGIDINDVTDDPNRKVRNKRHEVCPLAPIVIAIFTCLLCYLVDRMDSCIPNPISDSDAGLDKFSAVRAHKDLLKLNELGAKVVGSDACVKAAQVILTKLDAISTGSKQEVLVDRQQASGHYWSKSSTPFINSYANVVNVVAMLVGKSGFKSQSLLINCHYDSVPESPGASDDIINCAAMLEVLTILSKREAPLRHNIIFLFNGAEETSLQASHAFITQHKWAKNVSAFINLESAGMGGRECLFQAGPGRAYLVKTYANVVPYPHAQVIGEELFQNRHIPSDTDFRIFREFADIPGLDIAFAKYGQVYHTRFDNISLISLGSLQRLGENLLALSKALADSYHLDFKEPQDDSHNMVYFDFIGIFIVTLNAKLALIINWFVVVFGFFTTFPQFKKIAQTSSGRQEIFFCLLFSIMSSIMALFVACYILPSLATIGVNLTGGFFMKWYSRYWLIIPMYCLPTIVAYLATSIFCNTKRSYESSCSPIERMKLHLALRQFLWSLFIAGFLICGTMTRAAYILTIPLFIISFSTIILDSLSWYFNIFCDYWWIYAKLGFLVLNLFWGLYHSLLIFGLFLPILGRDASRSPETKVGTLCFLCIALTTKGMAGLEILLSRSRKSVIILKSTMIFIIALMIIIMLVPIDPYNAGELPSPQRYLIMHSSRKFYNGNSSAGYWILGMDANSPYTILKTTKLNHSENNQQPLSCINHLGCGYPHTSQLYTISKWIEAPPPKLPTEATVTLLSKECLENNTCKLTFKIMGPTIMRLMISGKKNVNVSTMGIDATVYSSSMWKKRPVLLIYHTSAEPAHQWILEIEAKLPRNYTPNETFLEFALSGHSTFHNEYRTAEFRSFLSKFPEWTDVTSFLSSYETFLF